MLLSRYDMSRIERQLTLPDMFERWEFHAAKCKPGSKTLWPGYVGLAGLILIFGGLGFDVLHQISKGRGGAELTYYRAASAARAMAMILTPTAIPCSHMSTRRSTPFALNP